ncbi:F0F1 ATP synthase subunit B, partial [Patescibacteria group bacterium]|nr:F0F1 ATP synthase subunit B [Patescibacteria group bacterium]
GINWKILLGQIINFLLVLYLLKRFALKPFLKTLTERKEKIERGIEKTAEAEKRIKVIEQGKEKILKESREKANLILRKSEERGKEKEEEILKRTEEEKMRILAEAKRLGQIEVNKMKGEFSKKNLELVLNLTEKILKEKVDLKKDSEIIKSFLSHF